MEPMDPNDMDDVEYQEYLEDLGAFEIGGQLERGGRAWQDAQQAAYFDPDEEIDVRERPYVPGWQEEMAQWYIDPVEDWEADD